MLFPFTPLLAASASPHRCTEGSPVNSSQFILNPLIRGLGYRVPKFSMDLKHALIISGICWFMYMLLFPWLGKKCLPQPLILPSEACKIGVTHYFSILKARQELGYVPLISPWDGVTATVSYFHEKKRRELDGPTIYLAFCYTGDVCHVLCSISTSNWTLSFNYQLHLFIFRYLRVIRLVFIVASVLHVGEGIYAFYLARRVDPKNTKGWFWQTK